MISKISLILGQHSVGWLPVDFKYEEFELCLYVSLVLNYPIEEIYDLTMDFKRENKVRQIKTIKYFLEPLVYLFDFYKRS